MCILILDDNRDLTQLLGLSLRGEGFQVMTFTSVIEALKNIHAADVLLTDYHMPEMTGLEVARRAYAQGWRGSLYIMSGHSSAIREQVIHPLLCSILDKPFSPREFSKQLRAPSIERKGPY